MTNQVASTDNFISHLGNVPFAGAGGVVSATEGRFTRLYVNGNFADTGYPEGINADSSTGRYIQFNNSSGFTPLWGFALGGANDFSINELGLSDGRIFIQKGSGFVGINNINPASPLDISGTTTLRQVAMVPSLPVGTQAIIYQGSKLFSGSVRDTLPIVIDAKPACLLERIGVLIVIGVIQPITFPTEIFDTDLMHNNLVNTGRITIQTSGRYIINAHCGFNLDPSLTGTGVIINKNGSVFKTSINVPSVAIYPIILNQGNGLSICDNCIAGDFYDMSVVITGTGVLGSDCRFSVNYIS